MSVKSSSFATSAEPTLIWNGPIDAEETFETKMSELKTKLIKESIYHCVNEKDSTDRIAARPLLSQLTTPFYATRFLMMMLMRPWGLFFLFSILIATLMTN